MFSFAGFYLIVRDTVRFYKYVRFHTIHRRSYMHYSNIISLSIEMCLFVWMIDGSKPHSWSSFAVPFSLHQLQNKKLGVNYEGFEPS